MSQYCILIHYHELALKRDNKAWFEKIFQTNIKTQIEGLPYKNINTYASRVFIYGINEKKWKEYKNKLKNVMGLKNLLLMQKVDAKINLIQDIANNISHNLLIIGVGGVDSGKSAFEKIICGATLVQLYTGMVYKGPGIASKISSELIDILKNIGFKNVSEAIGTKN